MAASLALAGNPSSVHQAGRTARHWREKARQQVAAAIKARAQNIIFTSGGTEANALALRGLCRALQSNITLFVSDLEHSAVLENAALCESAHLCKLPVTDQGQLDIYALEQAIARLPKNGGVPVLALMLANNETGILQPVREAADIVHKAGGFIHCDGVQGLGKIPIDIAQLDVDYLALSAHKCGGPSGVGALWVRPGAPLAALMPGGGQENSLRSGTENLPGIVGFGRAAEKAVAELSNMQGLAIHRDRLEAQIKAAGGLIIGADRARLPNTSCFAYPGFASETQVMAMDLEGVCVSAGAACSSGKVKRSDVLSAMGVSDTLAMSAIRTSYGWNSTSGDFDKTAEKWLKILTRFLG